MFSGCCIQGTATWKGFQTRERLPVFFYPITFLRYMWAAHINDRKCNQAFERRIQCRIFHAQATADGLLNPTALKSLSTSDSPTLLLPWPKRSKHQPPPIKADSPDQVLNSEAFQELENSSHVDGVLRFDSVGQFEEAPPDEALHREAARTPITARSIQIKKQNEIKRSTSRQLIEKSFLSYDWRVPLQLLKKYSKPKASIHQTCEDNTSKSSHKKAPEPPTDMIYEPKRWSKSIFDRYVYDLISFEPPVFPVSGALGLRRPWRRGLRTIPEVGDTLHDLFHRKELRKFLEPRICNTAINFFARHGMISQARSLFFVMEHFSMDIPFSTINIFMRAAAHLKDLHVFSWLLIIMIRRGLKPDSETWTIFLQFFDSVALKKLIIHEMARLGMLNDTRIKKLVMSSTIKDEIVSFLAGNRDPRDFLNQKRLKHGPDWLNTKRGNIILNEVCKRISLAAGLDLLEPLKEHGFKPDVVSLNIPLFQILKRRSLPLAAYVLDVFATKHNIVPDQDGYQGLFVYARDRGYLNVSRLVWIAACLNGAVTMQMQAKVRHSLYVNALIHGDRIRQPRRLTSLPGQWTRVFTTFMGNFVLGLPPFDSHSPNKWRKAISKDRMMFKTERLKYSVGFHL